MGYLILHGWQGSGPGHWQTWLADRLRGDGHDVRYPDLPDPDHPRLDAWLAALEHERRPGDTVICHSLSCCLWLHHRARGGPAADRVLLVAPPCLDPPPPELANFFPVPRDPSLAANARLVCSDDDPYCADASGVYGARLDVPVDLLPGTGHINTEAGFGPWPAVLDWCYGAKNGVDT
ncbi:MAG TPA: alpha/beta hydrolase [Solirubrobacteraceae bacterium]|nr:alpha/beta hydrolase [Solirubrobacteraceae bacterium]